MADLANELGAIALQQRDANPDLARRLEALAVLAHAAVDDLDPLAMAIRRLADTTSLVRDVQRAIDANTAATSGVAEQLARQSEAHRELLEHLKAMAERGAVHPGLPTSPGTTMPGDAPPMPPPSMPTPMPTWGPPEPTAETSQVVPQPQLQPVPIGDVRGTIAELGTLTPRAQVTLAAVLVILVLCLFVLVLAFSGLDLEGTTSDGNRVRVGQPATPSSSAPAPTPAPTEPNDDGGAQLDTGHDPDPAPDEHRGQDPLPFMPSRNYGPEPSQ